MIPALQGMSPKVLDRFEKISLSVIFAIFAVRMIRGYLDNGSPETLLYLYDQLIVLGFLLARRTTDAISIRPADWIAGYAGTFAPLLLAPPGSNTLLPHLAVLIIMLSGTGIHIAAKLTLRRSFGVVAANRGVKVSGIYKLVRHPMYLGYMVTQAGLLLAGPTLTNAILVALCWGLFVWRISAEERLLQDDPTYRQAARYRLLPGVY